MNLCIDYGDAPENEREFEQWFHMWLRITAEQLVPTLGRTITLLSLLTPRPIGAQWVQYQISNTDGTERVVSETGHEQVRC